MSDPDGRAPGELPIPPFEMRQLVGPTDEAAFRIEPGTNVFDDIPEQLYESVFDLGCGCGRVARKLMLQRTPPSTYVGVDIHRGMLCWCRENLSTPNVRSDFRHLDAYNPGLNPEGLCHPDPLPLPAEDQSASLVIAWSVFTHLVERQIADYLAECARVLAPGGLMRTTWFFFDKTEFPMMQEFQNCLYINDTDPTNAVIVDRIWFLDLLENLGLVMSRANPLPPRGFQWVIDIEKNDVGRPHVPWPDAPQAVGIARPPLMPEAASEIGS